MMFNSVVVKMNKRLVRYSQSVHWNDRLLIKLAIGVFLVFLLLDALITKTIASGYTGEAIERVSYSYIYSFPGRVGYILPLVLAAYIMTSSLRSGQVIRIRLLGGSKKDVFSSLLLAAVIFAGLIGTVQVIVHQLTSAAILHFYGNPANLFTSSQLFPTLRTILLQWCWALIGAGLGVIIRNQAILIGIVLTFALFVEPAISAASNNSESLMSVTKWLPGPLNWACSWDGGAGSAAIRAVIGLPGPIAILVMMGYSIVVCSIAYYLFSKRPLKTN